jgi:hypothetical protein
LNNRKEIASQDDAQYEMGLCCLRTQFRKIYSSVRREGGKAMLFEIKDKSGKSVGYVMDNGEVKDMKAKHLGKWDSDGDLFNSSGSRINRISRGASHAAEVFFLLGGH